MEALILPAEGEGPEDAAPRAGALRARRAQRFLRRVAGAVRRFLENDPFLNNNVRFGPR